MPNDQIVALIDGLRDPSAYVRYDSAYQLSKRGRDARAAVPSLIRTLEDADEWVSSWSAHALGRVRPIAEEAIPALIKRLGDENEQVGSACAGALQGLGEAAIPSLLRALKEGDERARERSAWALRWLTPVSREAIPALINALGDDCEKVRNASANALGSLRQPALPALVNALTHENEWVRAKSAYAIGRMGLDAKEAMPALVSALRDKNRRVRSKSARALNRIRAIEEEARAIEEETQQYLRTQEKESFHPKAEVEYAANVEPREQRSGLAKIISRIRDAMRVLAGVRPAEVSFDEVDDRIAEWCAAMVTDEVTALLAPETDDLDAYDDIHRRVNRFVLGAIKDYASHEARHGPVCREQLRRENVSRKPTENETPPEVPF